MKALIIDDSPTVCSVIKYVFQHEGWELKMAGSTESGMEILKKEGQSIDLIIVDHTFRHIDGISFLKEFKKQGICPKSIVISQDDRLETILEAQSLGAKCWMHKPISLDRILTAIDHALAA